MGKISARILILEDDTCFREILENICSPMGETLAVGDIESALGLLAKQSFQLLLLDWHLNQSGLSSLYSIIENFQANTKRIALFTVPDLPNVIAAMKAGASDILWAAQEKNVLKEKISECLSQSTSPVFSHSFVSRLAETLTEKAMVQKTPLFQARREFSKTFLQQILSQQKLRRTQLANLMSVSPRTLHRHLSA
jgi:DNA-binding NtrC family response regulator